MTASDMAIALMVHVIADQDGPPMIVRRKFVLTAAVETVNASMQHAFVNQRLLGLIVHY